MSARIHALVKRPFWSMPRSLKPSELVAEVIRLQDQVMGLTTSIEKIEGLVDALKKQVDAFEKKAVSPP